MSHRDKVMTKALALELASALTLFQVQPAQLSRYYDEAIYALGTLPYIFEASLLDVDVLQATFQFPETALQVLELWYDNRTLDYMTREELAALSSYWLSERGEPLAYTDRDMNLRTFQLYPVPELASVPATGLPAGGLFGENMPHGHVAFLASSFQEDVVSWLELPLIYSTLAREYLRESDHQDPAFAQGCLQVARMLLDMVRLPMIQ